MFIKISLELMMFSIKLQKFVWNQAHCLVYIENNIMRPASKTDKNDKYYMLYFDPTHPISSPVTA